MTCLYLRTKNNLDDITRHEDQTLSQKIKIKLEDCNKDWTVSQK